MNLDVRPYEMASAVTTALATALLFSLFNPSTGFLPTSQTSQGTTAEDALVAELDAPPSTVQDRVEATLGGLPPEENTVAGTSDGPSSGPLDQPTSDEPIPPDIVKVDSTNTQPQPTIESQANTPNVVTEASPKNDVAALQDVEARTDARRESNTEDRTSTTELKSAEVPDTRISTAQSDVAKTRVVATSAPIKPLAPVTPSERAEVKQVQERLQQGQVEVRVDCRDKDVAAAVTEFYEATYTPTVSGAPGMQRHVLCNARGLPVQIDSDRLHYSIVLRDSNIVAPAAKQAVARSFPKGSHADITWKMALREACVARIFHDIDQIASSKPLAPGDAFEVVLTMYEGEVRIAVSPKLATRRLTAAATLKD